jgi:hypothetical protein
MKNGQGGIMSRTIKIASFSAFALLFLMVSTLPLAAQLQPRMTPLPIPPRAMTPAGPMTMTFRPDFFTSGLGNLAHLEDCQVHIQTGGASRFEPSPDLAGLGATAQSFQVPTVDEDVQVIVGYNRVFDIGPCTQWGLAHPGANPRDCPHYRDDPVTAKFHLKMDVNDLGTNRSGVRGSFQGTNLILEMGFEEDGKELSGVVTKKVLGVADVSFPFKGDLASVRATLTFTLSASNGALVVSFASLGFNASVSLDAYDHQIPQQLMDKLKLRDQFLASAKPRIEAAVRTSALPAAIQGAFANFLRTFGMRRVDSVRAGNHGGADVVGQR